jgi:hypothetical protein
MTPRTVEDVEGPWDDADVESGLIDRCRRSWTVPVEQLSNAALAMFLRQRIAVPLIAPEARRRIRDGIHDDSEQDDDELADALKAAPPDEAMERLYADWPFDQPPSSAAITLRSIVFERAPILHVSHDKDDHGWQFLGLEDADPDQAAVVGMETVLKLDPSVREVADLPPGWHAWRESRSSPWRREPSPSNDE